MFSPLKGRAFRTFRKAETLSHELNYLFWECTTRCMLDCLHCGSDCRVDSTHPDMPAEDFLSALDTIDKPVKNFIVALTGGEPLLRNDLETVGMEIRQRKMRWGIVSNGHLYSQERHKALLNAGMGALTISLDGLKESHEWLRNTKGSFARVERAIADGTDPLTILNDCRAGMDRVGELYSTGEYFLSELMMSAWIFELKNNFFSK